MVDARDRDAMRMARTLLTRHRLDISRADIHVLHGTCYIRGIIIPEAGHQVDDTRTEVQRVSQFIRQQPGIRNVIVECAYQ